MYTELVTKIVSLMIPNWLNQYSVEQLGFSSGRGRKGKFCLHYNIQIGALGPTQLPIQWVLEGIFPWK